MQIIFEEENKKWTIGKPCDQNFKALVTIMTTYT